MDPTAPFDPYSGLNSVLNSGQAPMVASSTPVNTSVDLGGISPDISANPSASAAGQSAELQPSPPASGPGLTPQGGQAIASGTAALGQSLDAASKSTDVSSGVLTTLIAGASGAGTGAAIGSAVPVIGTGIGAAAGGLIGLVGGGLEAYLNVSNTRKANRDKAALLAEIAQKQKQQRADQIGAEQYNRQEADKQQALAIYQQNMQKLNGVLSASSELKDKYLQTGLLR